MIFPLYKFLQKSNTVDVTVEKEPECDYGFSGFSVETRIGVKARGACLRLCVSESKRVSRRLNAGMTARSAAETPP
jgi:hypothetical protein